MSFFRSFAQLRSLALVVGLLLLSIGTGSNPASAQDDIESLRPLINALAEGKYKETEKQIGDLAATGSPAVAPALEALSDGDLYFRKSDNQVFITKKSGKGYALTDPLTLESAGEAGRREVKKIKVNNKLRRVIRSALGSLTLMAADPKVRKAAAEAVFKAKDPDAIESLDTAIEKETNDEVRMVMEQARAAAVLNSDRSDGEKLQAVQILSDMGNRDALSLLIGLRDSATGELQTAAATAVKRIEKSLVLWDNAQNIWYGLSLGSVLLLAAIGLAITFGVMGVINMAHGEMVMIGAYVTFVVQEMIRTSAPGLFDYSLLIALPLAFLVSGAIGVGIERGIIRWLYGRPLETLLATWGLSLILQQAVRSLFGPTNREVGNPDWMSGAFEIGQMTITYNRMWIILFALAVFVGLMLVLKKTPFGLYTRAVTQNRRMAASMGIRTPWIDALTFGLGSGIAGIAGVALSQIDNVSPNLGQGYIIDSFMVVVFGGVGNLWGTLVGAMTLGVVNKFLEPYAGAVLGKIFVLVFIILFIQKRPRGLFALKGRAVEA
jgi:urea transport system permease protein